MIPIPIAIGTIGTKTDLRNQNSLREPHADIPFNCLLNIFEYWTINFVVPYSSLKKIHLTYLLPGERPVHQNAFHL